MRGRVSSFKWWVFICVMGLLELGVDIFLSLADYDRRGVYYLI